MHKASFFCIKSRFSMVFMVKIKPFRIQYVKVGFLSLQIIRSTVFNIKRCFKSCFSFKACSFAFKTVFKHKKSFLCIKVGFFACKCVFNHQVYVIHALISLNVQIQVILFCFMHFHDCLHIISYCFARFRGLVNPKITFSA